MYLDRYDALAADVELIVNHFRQGPTFLFGHSFGGQVVLWTAQHIQLQVNALIVASPWLGLVRQPSRWKLILAKILNGPFPAFRLPTGVNRGQLSHDQAELDSLDDLELVHYFVTLRAYFQAKEAAAAILAVSKMNYPIMYAHGDADELTSREIASDFFARLQAPAKLIKIYPGMRHELHNETGREKVLADYVEWMKSANRIGSPGRAEGPNRS
jgi:acylglycerol lipase